MINDELRNAIRSDLFDVAKHAIHRRILELQEEEIIDEEEGKDLLKEILDLIEGE